MGFWSKLFGTEELRAAEAYGPWGGSGGINDPDPDSHLYRRLTDNVQRELEPLAQDRAIETAFYMYKSNPMAHRIIETYLSYIIGGKVKVKAEDKDVQEVIDAFWKDPVNNMDLKLPNKLRWLFVYGEQLYPLFVNPATGKVRMSYVDPELIDRVCLDKNNVEIIDSVSFKYYDKDKQHNRTIDHINVSDIDNLYYAPESPVDPLVMYWSINRPPNAERGTGMLLPLLDWLDILDTFMMTTAERAQFQLAHIWDVTYEGLDDKQIRDHLNRMGPMRPGTVRAHNERVTWNSVAPKLGSEDISIYGADLKKYIGVGVGLPGHFLGEEGSSNKASASEASVPVIKNLQFVQLEVEQLLRQLIAFVIDMSIRAGQLNRSVNKDFVVHLPSIWGGDMSKIANSLAQVTNSAVIAEQNGYISAAQAKQTIEFMVNRLGIDFEDQTELETEIFEKELAERMPEITDSDGTVQQNIINRNINKATKVKPAGDVPTVVVPEKEKK